MARAQLSDYWWDDRQERVDSRIESVDFQHSVNSGKRHTYELKMIKVTRSIKLPSFSFPLQFIRHGQENHILWVSSMLLLYSITTKPRLTEVYHDLKGCEGRQR